MRTLFVIIACFVLVLSTSPNAAAEEQIPLTPENCYLIEGKWSGNTYILQVAGWANATFHCRADRVHFFFHTTYKTSVGQASGQASIREGVLRFGDGIMELFQEGNDLVLRGKFTLKKARVPRFEGVLLRKRLVREGAAASLTNPHELFQKARTGIPVRLSSGAVSELAGETLHGAWRLGSKKEHATLYFEGLGGGIVMGRLTLYGRPVPRHAGIAGVTDEGKLDIGGGFSFGGRRLEDGTALVLEGLDVPDGTMDVVFVTDAKLTP